MLGEIASILLAVNTVMINNDRLEPTAELVVNCQTIEACFRLIETELPERDIGISYPDNQEIAIILKDRFGEEGRAALLQKAVGDHGGWRNFADGVLAYWGDWSVDDIPILTKILGMKPGSMMIAHVLADIGTEEAIKALVINLKPAGSGNQTVHALTGLPAEQVLPHILLALDERSEPGERSKVAGAQSVISSYGEDAVPFIEQWVLIVQNEQNRIIERLSATRAIAATGTLGRDYIESLIPILLTSEGALRVELNAMFVEVRHPEIMQEWFEECLFVDSDLNKRHAEWQVAFCLSNLAEFGTPESVVEIIGMIAPFVKSKSSVIRTAAIEAIGYLQGDENNFDFYTSLKSHDWREVLTTVVVLNLLQDEESLVPLRALERSHWWSFIRESAGMSWRATSEGRLAEWPEVTEDEDYYFSEITYVAGLRIKRPPAPSCENDTWVWRRQQFSFEQVSGGQQVVELPGGKLIGHDRGEWGGELYWLADDGEKQIIIDDNINALFPIQDGAVVLSGLSHLFMSSGRAYRVTRKQGEWTVEDIGEFPGATYQYAILRNNAYAVMSGDWPVVFNMEKILGIAECNA